MVVEGKGERREGGRQEGGRREGGREALVGTIHVGVWSSEMCPVY